MDTSDDTPRGGTIEVLPDAVARKIAAGEVIERPASVVRELIDNSIDANAQAISVELEEGGLSLIRVNDDGSGMNGPDLELCHRSHATSKVRSADDLLCIRSLGFRGEALASIASVARLEISSLVADGAGGRIVVEEGTAIERGRARGSRGTSIDVRRLFYNFPARKRFLKRAATELKMVREIVIEKSVSHPHIEFKLVADGAVKLMLLPQERCSRVAATRSSLEGHRLIHIEHEGKAARVEACYGGVDLATRDRRNIQVYVNGRRIKEFAFVQAVEYSLGDLFHGGTYPFCYLFLDVDPSTVDFNIHPAKLEAKFEQREQIHHDVVTALRLPSLRENPGSGPGSSSGSSVPSARENVRESSRSYGFDRTAAFGGGSGGGSGGSSGGGSLPSSGHEGARQRFDPAAFTASSLRSAHSAPDTASDRSDLHFHGRAFGVFLIVERGDSLYFVDQHAAHERILFDSFRSRGRAQKLLVPIDFETESSEQQSVRDRVEEAQNLGIEITETADGRFRISSVPESFSGSESLLVESLRGIEIISGEFERDLFATMACKAAIRGGDWVDELTAVELASRALALPEPRCPHGRPLWWEVNRRDLLKYVGRE